VSVDVEVDADVDVYLGANAQSNAVTLESIQPMSRAELPQRVIGSQTDRSDHITHRLLDYSTFD
jgi:hypothetical protein